MFVRNVTYVAMIVMSLAWLALPFLALAGVGSVAWFVARWHTRREIDRAYEQLCRQTGKDIF